MNYTIASVSSVYCSGAAVNRVKSRYKDRTAGRIAEQVTYALQRDRVNFFFFFFSFHDRFCKTNI